MRNRINLSLILLIAFFSSSCIELEEELTIRPDQSGNISYTLHIKQSGGLLGIISGYLDKAYEDQLKEKILIWVAKLEKQDGISGIQFNGNPSRGNVYLSWDFQNGHALNNALYTMTGNKKTLLSPSYIKIQKHKLKKFNFSPFVKQYLKKEAIDLDPTLLSYMSFTTIIQTSEKIKKLKGEALKINDQNTQVSQHFEVDDIINNRVSTSIRLRY